MCILCRIQAWSRMVATILPWLVIPMIGLWALSQFFPPAFRFEITSTRLACVSVLLITLFWYEILMPNLSTWRMRRSAKMREKKRFEAIEMQKLRKTAIRRCRNCLTTYKEQNPCVGGKFMCSFCGHVSKRPMLDLPVPHGLSSSGVWKDWLENGSCARGPFDGKASVCQKNGRVFHSNEDKCQSFSLLPKMIMYLVNGILWLVRKITGVSSSSDAAQLDAERRRLLAKRGDNAGNFNESRGEKARRKAEEKRQARIERELLEEEERKQREEVARLVEERRKLRDEIMDAEKDSCRSVSASKEKERKKEGERKRQERRKEKDKGSSKSNSDVEEIERRASKESDRKKEFDKKNETTRYNHHIDTTHVNKKVGSNNYSRGNAGSRYLDRMKGTILSSSKALGGSSFFGRGSNTTSAAVSREKKPNSANIRDFSTPIKSSTNGEVKAISRPVFTEPQPAIASKKTWGQLFTRTTPVVTNSNMIARPCGKPQSEVRSPPFMGYSSSGQVYNNPIDFGPSSPYSLPTTFSYAPASSCTVPPLTSEAMFPRIGDVLPEDYEIFGDPCYVPDPVSLLGPVSESLDDFQLDLGPGFATDIGLQRPVGALKRISTGEVNRPSPIKSPMSEQSQDSYKSPKDNSFGGNQNGTWQMWNTLPLGQEGLGLVGCGGPTSLFSNDNQVFSRTHSPQKVFSSAGHNVGNFVTPVTGSTIDPWLPTDLFAQIPDADGRLSSNHLEDSFQNEMIYGSPNSSKTNHSFKFPDANGWAKNDRTGSAESTGSSTSTKPHIGGLYSTPDVHSLWSYDLKEES